MKRIIMQAFNIWNNCNKFTQNRLTNKPDYDTIKSEIQKKVKFSKKKKKKKNTTLILV